MAAAYVVRRRRGSLSSSSSELVSRMNAMDVKQWTLPFQQDVNWLYLQNSVQIFVAVLILLNFITAAANAQILPEDGSSTSRLFVAFEYFYVYAFLVELVFNMYGHFFWDFWKSGWNWFDFIIVVVSFLALYFPHLPAISVLRLFRAFRVVRLFKRVQEMRKIIEGIMRSLPALSYAFIAMGLIMGIWGIMGVGFFGDYTNEDTFGISIEGYFFGTFFRAILSLGQIMTFDSWSSGIARDIIYEDGVIAAVFFLSYIFVAGIIMMNVLVALLLDNYLTENSYDDNDSLKEPTRYTPEIVFRELLKYLRRTEIDLEVFSGYLVQRTFPEYEASHKVLNIQSDGYITLDTKPIASSLLDIEKQITLLRRKEHDIYHSSTIGNFSFQSKVKIEEIYSLPYQKEIKRFYLLRSIQIFVALVIFMNFLTSSIYAQILPEEGSQTDKIFLAFEWFYAYGFLVELLINMYGSFFCLFWHSGWNIFDFIIVWVSLVAMYFPALPGISVLRLFRAFRVVRLFKRVEEMKKIIEGIMKSLPSLSYAFIALALITGIWAIIGVDFYGKMYHGGVEGYYFGNFFRAFLSLLQITTFDSWSSGIARDIIFAKGEGAAFYFVVYVFFSSVIMMNVLVALLLDNYLTPTIENDKNELSPEEAMWQITTHALKIELDLDKFSDYLREQAFPDFISRYQDVEDCGYVSAEGNAYRSSDTLRDKQSTDVAAIEMLEVMAKTNSSAGISINLDDIVSSDDC